MLTKDTNMDFESLVHQINSFKEALKCKIHYPFKWIELDGNVKTGYCILQN